MSIARSSRKVVGATKYVKSAVFGAKEDEEEVKEKLRKTSEFKMAEEEELGTKARELVRREDLEDTFSHLWDIYGQVEMALGEAATLENIDQTSTELGRAYARADRRLKEVAKLPVYLYLTELQGKKGATTVRVAGTRLVGTFATLIDAEYGPHHAALVIGDIVLEWDDSSLVNPAQKELMPVFRANMQRHHSHWINRVKEAHKKMFAKVTMETANYGAQIEAMVDLNAEKKALIDRMIDVIIRYNSFHYYHVFSRNCHHFVKDVLEALGITESPTFTGRLKEYYDALRKTRQPGQPKEFPTHEDLDSHVMKNFQSLTPDDIEYFLCQYYSFHTKEAADNGGDRSRCSRPPCQMMKLDERITQDGIRLRLEDYRRTL